MGHKETQAELTARQIREAHERGYAAGIVDGKQEGYDLANRDTPKSSADPQQFQSLALRQQALDFAIRSATVDDFGPSMLELAKKIEGYLSGTADEPAPTLSENKEWPSTVHDDDGYDPFDGETVAGEQGEKAAYPTLDRLRAQIKDHIAVIDAQTLQLIGAEERARTAEARVSSLEASITELQAEVERLHAREQAGARWADLGWNDAIDAVLAGGNYVTDDFTLKAARVRRFVKDLRK